jgi:hypothetical protein
MKKIGKPFKINGVTFWQYQYSPKEMKEREALRNSTPEESLQASK